LQIVDVVERGCFVLQIAFVLASRRIEHRFHGAVAFMMTPDQKQATMIRIRTKARNTASENTHAS
jgi:hypothetical protein